MAEIDRMDIVRYLEVLAYEQRELGRRADRQEDDRQSAGGTLLRRGSIDDVFL